MNVKLGGMPSESNQIRTWMRDYCQGDLEAFDRLYAEFAPRVMGYLRSKRLAPEECDEVFQSIWVKFHQCRDRYDPRFAVLNWIFVIARSCLTDFYRQSQRRSRKEGGDITPEIEQGFSFREWLEKSDAQQTQASLAETESYLTLLEDISPEQRKAVELRILNEMDYEEIARALKTTEANSRQLVSRGLKRIRKIWGGAYNV